MKRSDYFFELPESLIAQHPPPERGGSRLMVLDRGSGRRQGFMVRDLPSILERGTLMVFNNSRVRKARLLARAKETGAAVEFLLLNKEEAPGAASGTLWKAMVKRSRRRRPGSRYVFADRGADADRTADGAADGTEAVIEALSGEFCLLRFERPIGDPWLDRWGHIPLPPYIKREDTEKDGRRYQTVYASSTGSAAAPTAGLHFTRELLDELEKAGMETAFITLHVGLGTFLPVRAENIEDHVMHEESFSIDDETALKIEKAKKERRPILAVGTTSIRTLESAWDPEGGRLRRGEGRTSIFIYPGYDFKTADMLFTNFHTPESTLLMLVAAFAEAKAGAFAEAKTGVFAPARAGAPLGRELILGSYREAIQEGYRFFSYGDAMLIR
ncbi:MAG: tRNA preQ1(34) S-adenosylmethionine ribosyltransferase-isomerase QueA [Treponema sp.]|jgi:S-adenosylmethionine:tRNA ribosyltransferase-isomerase|nr:tRNA preQ1(34) S-adenosylmethionine ribosyltransferase-isomerase QueA [Treponema sp.]